MQKICNQAWHEGKAPTEWTKSVIITTPKDGDLADCNNYRTISLLSHASKVLMMVLLERLKAQMEPHMSEEQAGFRKDRNTTHQILILRLLAEKAIYHCLLTSRKLSTLSNTTSYGRHWSLIELATGYFSYCRTFAKIHNRPCESVKS